MEEETKKEEELEETPPEEEPQGNLEGEDEPKDESAEDIDHKKELEELESKDKPKDEKEKARRALFFNAERARELGLDPAEVLNLKESKETPEVSQVVQREFDVREAKSRAKSEDEFKLIMWYVDNRKLSVDEAYLLANKGRIARSGIEARRADVEPGKEPFSGRKETTGKVPPHPGAEMLQRRGYSYNPKTQTYQAKFYEEYYDAGTKSWVSRKLKR